MSLNPLIITGATGSMGAVAVSRMAAEGYPVIMACRNLKKGEELRGRILSSQPDACLELVRLDLESSAGVDEFVKAMEGLTFSGIFNNAGVISRDFSMTEDGIEHTMAVNFVNPARLTLKLLPQFEQGAHIVNMVSLTTKYAHLDENWKSLGEKEFSQLGTYGRTKLALLYFSIALARHCPQFHVNVSDPGVVNSNMISMGRWFDPLADIFFRPFISSPEKGVAPALRALHFDGSMQYFVGKGHKDIPSSFCQSAMPEILWQSFDAGIRPDINHID